MTKEEELFSHYRGGTVLLDSNLLLLLLAGNLGLEFFPRFPRVGEYHFDDYEFLKQALNSFRTILVTPHILTEVSNLANKLSGARRFEWSEHMETFIEVCQERYIPARELARTSDFEEFGIADSAIGALASEALILTDDHRLSGSLRSRGLAVLNFKELRAVWDAIY